MIMSLGEMLQKNYDLAAKILISAKKFPCGKMSPVHSWMLSWHTTRRCYKHWGEVPFCWFASRFLQ